MGISLHDCACGELEQTARRVYEKIVRLAGNLVRVGEEIESDYGVPIVNKRLSVTPVALLGQHGGGQGYLAVAQAMDRAAKQVGVDFIGGYSALVQKGYTKGDRALIDSIPDALAQTEKVCASVNVASTRAGINMDAVRHMGEIIKKTARNTADRNAIGCAKLVVFANAVEDNPFMAGAFPRRGRAGMRDKRGRVRPGRGAFGIERRGGRAV